ncbi:hypothetical protein CPB84DRAFT_1780698 [Gymnopilus junonius]|uniref:F-box domain-containing protein n=1 Tax=Gymnopilus junonius TaxID=109634 RepID=A0A9P5NLL8_GYMJU|nr:hypothetical protein CPB84DRAFT_1780698 [Gymnopilus junonius]
MSTFISPLPLELLEHIIDNFDTSSIKDRKSLSQIASTCRSFAGISQKRLFHDVYIRITLEFYRAEHCPHSAWDRYRVLDSAENQASSGPRCLDILETSPHLANNVRSLTLMPTYETSSAGNTDWQPALSLYAIIPRLHNVQRFTISDMEKACCWECMDVQLRELMCGLLQTQLENSTLSFFIKCPSLKKLHFECLDLRTSDTEDFPIVPALEKPQLELLEILCFGAASDLEEDHSWFNSSYLLFDLTHLKSFKVTARYFFPTPKIPGMFSKSLENLELGTHDFFPGSHLCTTSIIPLNSSVIERPYQRLPPDLNALENLRTLKVYGAIHGTLFSFANSYETNLPFLSDMLKTLPCKAISTPILEVTLEIQVYHLPIEFALESVRWSRMMASVMNQDTIAARFAVFNLHLQRSLYTLEKVDFDASDIFDRDDGLKVLRSSGYLTYLPSKKPSIRRSI